MNVASRQWNRIFKIDITSFNHFCTLGRTLAYKSAYSLDKLYPTSNLRLFTPTFVSSLPLIVYRHFENKILKVPEDANAKFTGYIPLKELDVTYSRSSGPGGQHVNRTNTKVDLRFHVKSATWLSEEIKENLLKEQKNRLNKDGYLVIKSELTRSQQLNVANALEVLRGMIWKAAKPPEEIPVETEELKRKQLLRAARQRLFEKRRRSQIKEFRKPPTIDF